MADIRSFFAPKGGQRQPAAPAKKESPATKPRKRRNVVSDDEDEEPPAKPKKTAPKSQPKPAPKEEQVETSSYFASSGKNKITRSAAPAASKPKSKNIVMKKAKDEDDDINYIDDDDDPDFGDNVFKAEYGKAEDDYVPSQTKDDDDEDMLDEDEEEEEIVKPKTRSKGGRASTNSRKRKSPEPDDEDDYEDEDDFDSKPPAKKKSAAAAKATPAKKPASKKAKEEKVENTEMKEIFDAIPTVRPPTPPDRDPAQKFNYRDFKQRGEVAPPNAGSKDIPEGAENCLTGLTFVFTGILQSLERDTGIELVKRYGGKVTGAPSTKTSYVVLGDQAGPKKLETIHKYNLKTINEDGLFKLIETLPANGGSGISAQAMAKKKAEEEKKIIQAAKEMTISSPTKGSHSDDDPNAQLWTVKYAPSQMKDICGNKAAVEKLQRWLKNWPRALKTNFKMPGPDGSGVYRAVMIHGPPGIGKTTAAHLVAKLEGYDILEYNASDTRSKKLLDESLRGVIDNRSLMGYFAGDGKKVDKAKEKIVLIMDEVDGMSAGDRGGVGQLAALCKKTSVPIICICNDRRIPKMKPFDFATYDLGFRRPDAAAVRARMASIAYKEGLKIPGNVIDKLTEGTHSDIRQIINMLSTYRVSAKDMSFDQGKAMSSAWEKHVILKPWDIAQRLLMGGMFQPNSTKTLNDKIELYFNDHEFSYLMIQENYLKTNPSLASNIGGKKGMLERLKLADEAAQSISDGDLVDALIHGPQQHWSMMPTHAVFSTVIPCSRMAGGGAGQQLGFTSWLGNNSKYNKLMRFVKEIQSHMRLHSSADRHEVRQAYVPMFFEMMPKRLRDEGKDAVKDIIDLMDGYYLTKEDYDAILELGLGPNDMGNIQIDTATKAAFTRQYNAMSHPLSFMKASTVFAPKKGAKRDKPDLEEAIDESESEMEMLDAAKDEEEEEDMDVTKDKYVKQPKKKKAPAKKPAAGKSKGKSKANDDFIDDDDESDVKPKGKGKAAAKGNTRGRR